MKSLLYVANTTSTSVAADASIPFNTIVRRYGPLANLTGNDVYAKAGNCGVYARVTVTLSYTASAAGNVTLTLEQNGTIITGATVTQTITTASTEYMTATIEGIVRLYRSDEINKLSVITDSDITVTNANMIVEVY